MSSTRHRLCILLVMASTAALATGAFAANDGVPNPTPGATQGAPAPQAGAPGTPSCRQAKARSRPQLTPEQKAQRRAARQAAQGIARPHKSRHAKLPLC